MAWRRVSVEGMHSSTASEPHRIRYGSPCPSTPSAVSRTCGRGRARLCPHSRRCGPPVCRDTPAGYVLLNHDRPLAEVLAPARRYIAQEFERGFSGMTDAAVIPDELMGVRERLISAMAEDMPQSHRDLLLSFERGKPDWSLLGMPGVEDLPAVRWRFENLARLDTAKRYELLKALKEVLGVVVE